MKASLIIIFCSFLCSCNSSKYNNKQYTGGAKYWQYSIKLYADNTFENVLNAHLKSDTALGNYTTSGDTVFFKYRYNKDDSIEANLYRRNSSTQLSIALFSLKSNFRDSMAIFKNRRLLYNGSLLKRKHP